MVSEHNSFTSIEMYCNIRNSTQVIIRFDVSVMTPLLIMHWKFAMFSFMPGSSVA